jgi:heme A synthase
MPAVDDLKNLDRLDQAVLGAGVLALIFSFFPFLTVKVTGISIGSAGHESAWHGWGLLAVLLIVVATGLAAVRLFAAANLPKLPVGVNLLTLALSSLAFLFLLIHWVSNRRSQGVGTFKATEGLAWSGWILLLLVLAQAAAAFLLFKKSGEAMPDFKAMQANRATGAGTPPPPVYGSTPPAATYPPATSTPAGDYTMDDSTPPPPSA